MAVLTMMVGANISPEQLLSIAERTIMEADTGWGNFFFMKMEPPVTPAIAFALSYYHG